MFSYKKIIILGALLGVGAISYIVHYKNSISTTLDTNSYSAGIQQYQDQLKKEEQQIWARIGITPENYKKYHNHYYPEYLKICTPAQSASIKPISRETKKLIYAVLDDFGVDKNIISILPYNEFSPAAANDRTIYVNEKSLKTFSLKAQKFAIGHEVQHIIHKDDSAKFIVEQVLSLDVPNLKQRHHPFNQLSRFMESRADILTVLKNKEYAEGKIEFMQKLITTSGDTPGISHPKLSVRLQKGQKFLAQWQQNALQTA